MSRDLDTQLLESVAVRRARLREALVWGRERRLRATGDNLKRLAVGVVVAAVAVQRSATAFQRPRRPSASSDT